MKRIPQIGIMSGRLSEPVRNEIQAFPRYSWREEFERASNYGFELIEWVFDSYENNPILDHDQIKVIRTLSEKYGIKINAICADYFMEKKLFNVSEYNLEKNLNILKSLIERCSYLEIKILEIPLVDSSSLKNNKDKEELISNIGNVLSISEKNDVKITLETDLPPRSFKDLLLRFNHPNIQANYDTGNSTSLGYDVKEEFNEFGSWITNIHIKDRTYNGKTVPLGSGDTNFDLFFTTLKKINYTGDLIIQGARELDDPEIKPEHTCKKYLDFVKQYVDKYLNYKDGE